MNIQNLIGLQRAEFSGAIRLQVWIVIVQVLIALFAAVAVFLKSDLGTYLAALGAFVLTFVWALLEVRLKRRRGQADRARRAVVFTEGMGR